MKFKNWLDIIEDSGGGAASGGSAVGSGATAGGTGVAGSGATSSGTASDNGSPNISTNDSKSGGTDSKDIAKVPTRCCGWGIWHNYPISKKRKKRKN